MTMIISFIILSACSTVFIDEGFLGKWWKLSDDNIAEIFELENKCVIFYQAPTIHAGHGYSYDSYDGIEGPINWWRLDNNSIDIENLGTINIKKSNEDKATIDFNYVGVPIRINIYLCYELYEQ